MNLEPFVRFPRARLFSGTDITETAVAFRRRGGTEQKSPNTDTPRIYTASRSVACNLRTCEHTCPEVQRFFIAKRL